MPSRPLPLRLASTVLVTLCVLTMPTLVLAHSELDTASPGPDETVTVAPTELTATFTEGLDPAKSSIVIDDAVGKEVAKGGADSVQADGTTMIVPLPTLADGTYEVKWTTASAEDGDIAHGTYSFTVAVSANPSPSLSPSPSASASAAASPSASPAASPSSAASPSPVTSPSPEPSASPAPNPTDGVDASVALPIIVAIVIVALVAGSLIRRRPA